MIKEVEEDRVRAFIKRQKWTVAKTYEDFAPHQYIIKYQLPKHDQETFVRFIKFIRTYGYPQTFGKTTYMYVDFGQWKYWAMGFSNKDEEKVGINRALKKLTPKETTQDILF